VPLAEIAIDDDPEGDCRRLFLLARLDLLRTLFVDGRHLSAPVTHSAWLLEMHDHL